MFMVVIGTFAWRSILILRKVPKTDAFVTILVTAVTVATDLATAVVVGVIVASLSYAWNAAKHIKANSKISKDGQTKVYELEGPLFFGSCEGFAEIFNPNDDPDNIIVDFTKSQVVDQSALQSIEMLASKYEAIGKNIQLRHLSRDCHALLAKAGHLIIDSDDDPNYALAADYGVKTGIFGSH
jgi:SulP family sulfate permease